MCMNVWVGMCRCVCEGGCVYVCMCVNAWVGVCVYVCMWVCMCVFQCKHSHSLQLRSTATLRVAISSSALLYPMSR